MFSLRVISRPLQVLSSSSETHSQTLFASDGAFETISALLAFQYGMISLANNCVQLDPRYGLNLVQQEAQTVSVDAVLIGGRGAGGTNVVVALQTAHSETI